VQRPAHGPGPHDGALHKPGSVDGGRRQLGSPRPDRQHGRRQLLGLEPDQLANQPGCILFLLTTNWQQPLGAQAQSGNYSILTALSGLCDGGDYDPSYLKESSSLTR
jgi:hypothetical protein